MKYLIIIAILMMTSCKKSDQIQETTLVNGVYRVMDPAYALIAGNAEVELYHIFVGAHTFYRLSFNPTHDFKDLKSIPRADSLKSFYQSEDRLLMLPNMSPAPVNVVPGMKVIKSSNDEILFERYMVLRRSAIDGTVIEDRMDTILYKKETDGVKLNYFRNYIEN